MILAVVEFVDVEAGSTWVGSDLGGWIHAGQRPRHEVRLPEYRIMPRCLTEGQFASLLDLDSGPNGEEVKEGIDADLLSSVCSELSRHVEEGYEVRPPSLGEWKHARRLGLLDAPAGHLEILADAPSSDHRGAPMDGRPRPSSQAGPLRDHLACIEVHPSKQGVTATSSVPMDRALPGTVLRLVVAPVREGETRWVPKEADRWANLRTEAICTLLIGVIPSFLIPLVRGFGTYALEGWANLLFGGLVAGFVTGAVWRPRRPSVAWDDGRVQDEGSERRVSQ